MNYKLRILTDYDRQDGTIVSIDKIFTNYDSCMRTAILFLEEGYTVEIEPIDTDAAFRG